MVGSHIECLGVGVTDRTAFLARLVYLHVEDCFWLVTLGGAGKIICLGQSLAQDAVLKKFNFPFYCQFRSVHGEYCRELSFAILAVNTPWTVSGILRKQQDTCKPAVAQHVSVVHTYMYILYL